MKVRRVNLGQTDLGLPLGSVPLPDVSLGHVV